MSRFQKLGMVVNGKVVIIFSIPNKEKGNHDIHKATITINQ